MSGDGGQVQFGGTEAEVYAARGTSSVVPCDVGRAALALGCSLFGRVMTISETPKVNDVHKCESQ